ncbi:MAG: YggS family pyridoxal phosphate-dependent enzyme [Bacteroidales bacterium]
MSEVCINLEKIKNTVPGSVKILAVSKTKPVEIILEAYNCGQRLFAENKVQELELKFQQLPEDIEWHMIGHLQTNKVKYIAPFVKMIHSVDSLKLLEVINKEAIKNKRSIPFLFQMYIASEESKFGLSIEELENILQSSEYKEFKNIIPSGLMGMASFTSNEALIKKEFAQIKHQFDYLKDKYFKFNPEFCELSIGMSADYHLAVEYGSTIVRIGSSIFGSRK